MRVNGLQVDPSLLDLPPALEVRLQEPELALVLCDPLCLGLREGVALDRLDLDEHVLEAL